MYTSKTAMVSSPGPPTAAAAAVAAMAAAAAGAGGAASGEAEQQHQQQQQHQQHQQQQQRAAANDLRLIIPLPSSSSSVRPHSQQLQQPQQQPQEEGRHHTHASSASSSSALTTEVLHATPPSSPLPREGGRDFVLMGGVSSGATSHGNDGGGGDGSQHGRGQAHPDAAPGGVSSELMEKVDFIGPAESMKGPFARVRLCCMSEGIGTDNRPTRPTFSSMLDSPTALFRLPYTREPVSLALHRVSQETLIVEGALHELFGHDQQQAAADEDEEEEREGGARAATRTDPSASSKSLTALAPSSFRLPPGPLHLPPAPRDHNHLLHFRLRELSLLMGTDVQVFRNARHPGGVSALFYEESEGLELSHCLDSYLENVRAHGRLVGMYACTHACTHHTRRPFVCAHCILISRPAPPHSASK